MKNLKTTAPYNNPNSMQGGFLAKPKNSEEWHLITMTF